VPPKRSLLRIVVSATHTREHLDRTLSVLEACSKKVLKGRLAASKH
jgi:7-keto-8-aminopelargonate synthetase-like enzyme